MAEPPGQVPLEGQRLRETLNHGARQRLLIGADLDDPAAHSSEHTLDVEIGTSARPCEDTLAAGHTCGPFERSTGCQQSCVKSVTQKSAHEASPPTGRRRRRWAGRGARAPGNLRSLVSIGFSSVYVRPDVAAAIVIAGQFAEDITDSPPLQMLPRNSPAQLT